ncbi:MAG: hypothetical protein CMK43_06665 [Porticoccaceae bacterium]|nr:hypothetical protein [Porticoccaceae bacterium]
MISPGIAMILETLVMVTLLATDLKETAEAYHDHFGYRTISSGIINYLCAKQSGYESMDGQNFIIMRPPEGSPQVMIRFIEGGDPAYQPMLTSGWNAIELLARDPDKLSKNMVGRAFEVIGPPAYLTNAKNILAMQVTGPSNELVYLTHMHDPSLSLLKPQSPASAVGNTFIVVHGSNNLENHQQFLQKTFKNILTDPVRFKIDILAKARGDSRDTRYPIMLVKFAGPFGLEFDQYQTALPTKAVSGGIVLVSASVDSIDKANVDWIREPTQSRCVGLSGKTGLLQFPSGAKLEVLSPHP